MGPEAAYWAVLTGAAAEPGSPLAELIAGWLAAGNRSARELFELHPEMLAATLGRPVEELAALLALRARLPQAQRMLERLGRAGVDLLLRWDRRYPRALRGLADERHEAVLWYAGSLDLLEQDPVALAGPRDVGTEGRDFARAIAGAVAGQGRAVLGGLAQAVERVAMEGAMAREQGGAIAVLGQGIARALPDLLRLQGELRAGRLLVISSLPLETPWQPGYEPERGRTVVQLMDRVVLAQAQIDDGSWQLAQAALQAGRAVLVRAAETEACAALLAQGAMPIAWPAQGEEALAAEALRLPEIRARRMRELACSTGADHRDGQPAGSDATDVTDGEAAAAPKPRRKAAARSSGTATVDPAIPSAPATPGARTRATQGDGSAHARPQASAPAGVAAEHHPAQYAGVARSDGPAPEGDAVPEPGPPMEEALLRYLRRHRRRVTSKGLLLQALPAEEWAIDQALAALIATGLVTEHAHHTGAGYAPAALDRAADGGGSFQLSLFGQREGSSRAEQPPEDRSDPASLPRPTAAEGNGISR